ncbi:MAG: hypothetical protein ACI9QC_000961 [Oceanicoccus sp.]|jgi:hypothetical protein
MKKLLLFVTSLLILSACTALIEDTSEDNVFVPDETVYEEEDVVTVEDEIKVDEDSLIVPELTISNSLDGLEIGDKVAGLTVTDIEYYSSTSSPTEAFNSTITFEGEVTLSGDFIYYTEEDAFVSGMIGVNSLEYGADFPYVDTRSNYIMLSNTDEVAALMGIQPGDKGTVSFVIDEYQWIGLESEVFNHGHVTEVLSFEIE